MKLKTIIFNFTSISPTSPNPAGGYRTLQEVLVIDLFVLDPEGLQKGSVKSSCRHQIT